MGFVLPHCYWWCSVLSGSAKYEKILEKAKEKLGRGSQRDEATALGEAVAAEPRMEDSGTVVSRAAALSHTCHPPACHWSPCAPRQQLPGALLALGTSLQSPGHGLCQLSVPHGLLTSGRCPSWRCTSS